MNMLSVVRPYKSGERVYFFLAWEERLVDVFCLQFTLLGPAGGKINRRPDSLVITNELVGLSETFSELALERTAVSVLPSLSPMTRVGVFSLASRRSSFTSACVQA